MSELKRIADWNTRVGVVMERRELTDESVESQLEFINEEHRELTDAFEDGDLVEVLDACGDLLVVVSGLIHRLGYDPDTILKEINDSNYTKFVKTTSEAVSSVHSYENDKRYTNVRVDEYGVVWGTVRATGATKVLKGINYKPPRLDRLV